MNPAYMVRQLMDQYAAMYGVFGRITSRKFLNPNNSPDPWEIKALKAFEAGAEEVFEFTQKDGKPFLRLMRPMVTKEGCLKCHGFQGYTVGDVRGGVGVSVPIEPFMEMNTKGRTDLIITHLTIGFVGLLIIGFILLFSRRQLLENWDYEEERERFNAALASKNKELEQIVYVASHDLRSPLVNVQGFSKELSQDFADVHKIIETGTLTEQNKEKLALLLKEDIPEALQFIQTSALKMDSLLSGLLKISRLGRAAIDIKPLEMNKLIRDVADNFEFQTQRDHIDIQLGVLPPCCGDLSQVHQVFSNLVGNAIKFMSPDRPGIISISGYQEGGKSIYCVKDNGIGIADKHKIKIFEIFHQLSPQTTDGEGLGLTIVRMILERHKGEIWLDTNPDYGSSFYVALPASGSCVQQSLAS
jgi:signal transduction histidine kinase